mmetsp:Transcript_77545/g.244981  ORF Transcript_77545/g.244981 Transcript_77545/m.244981 type:complete len:241 (+) Transcript_77545:2-724(+)
MAPPAELAELAPMCPADAKKVFLIRHGNSTYNAWRDETVRTCTCLCATWRDHDAPLSVKGREQVQALRKEVMARGLHQQVQLVVCSPLTRAIDTALGGFWDVHGKDSSDGPVAGRPPVLALSLVAERLDTACDIGRPASELRSAYRDVDFGQVAEFWWYGGEDNCPAPGFPHDREPVDCCRTRVEEALQWLRQRPETCIAVVGHSAFFQLMTGSWRKMPNCGISELTLAPESEGESPSAG